MTVRELIAILAREDPDKEVYITRARNGVVEQVYQGKSNVTKDKIVIK